MLLCAGLSRRMGENADKLLLPYRGKTFLSRALELLDSLNFYEKIIISTGERLKKINLPPEVIAVINPHPEYGQGGSVRLGTLAASGSFYLFMGADQPLLDSDTLLWLLEASRDNKDKIVCPSVNNKPCNPVIFPARFRAELTSLSGDIGGRAVRKAHPEDCLILPAKAPRLLRDIDNKEDYLSLISEGEE